MRERYRRYSKDSLLPTADVARTGTWLFIGTLQERNRLNSELADSYIPGGRGATVALPLMAHARVQGALQLNFASDRHFPEPERAFLVTLVHLCALAIERIRSEQSDRQARDQFETFVSEQHRDRRALRESEEKFPVLFNESQDALGVAANGRILYVNSAYAEMLGYDAA